MKALIAVVLIALMPWPAGSSILLISTVNASAVYCSGAGNCSAYGTTVPDLANGANWTVHYRIKRDFANPGAGSRSWHFAAATIGGFPTQYLCGQPMLVWDATTNVNMLMRVYVGILGGLALTTVLTSSFDFDSDSAWHDITLTHTAAHDWTLYVDGSLDTTVNMAVTTGASCDVFIGAADNFNSCGFAPSGCYMMDLAAWSAVLPAGDIKALASCAARPNQVSANPDYWLPMDGGYTSIFPGPPDLSGNHHNGSAPLTTHYDYNDIPLKATNSSCSPATGEATH